MRFTRGTYVAQQRPADPGGYGGRANRRAMTYEAFVPAPVADIDIVLAGHAASDIADAEAALARMDQAGAGTAGLETLGRSLLRSEAVASSWIEALRVSHRRLAEAERGAPGQSYDEARRVLGNVHALAAAVEIGAASTPFEVTDIQSMHGMLMARSSVREDRERAGTFRTEPVFIGGTTPKDAEYVGPPADRVDDLVADLVDFVNTRQDLSPTVVAAVAHAQFESIHPFHDGNGRVGRCLVHTVLRRGGFGPVMPPVSIAIANMGRRYVDGLNAFRRNDLDGWISIFAPAITLACEATTGLARRLEDLRRQWGSTLRTARTTAGRRAPRSDSALVASLDVLADLPAFHAKDLAERLGVTWRAAQDAVVELQNAGIVRQVTAGRGNRLYEAAEIFDLLDAFEHDPVPFRTG